MPIHCNGSKLTIALFVSMRPVPILVHFIIHGVWDGFVDFGFLQTHDICILCFDVLLESFLETCIQSRDIVGGDLDCILRDLWEWHFGGHRHIVWHGGIERLPDFLFAPFRRLLHSYLSGRSGLVYFCGLGRWRLSFSAHWSIKTR